MREEISKGTSFLVVMINLVSLAVPQVSLMESGHLEPSGQYLLGTSTIGIKMLMLSLGMSLASGRSFCQTIQMVLFALPMSHE